VKRIPSSASSEVAIALGTIGSYAIGWFLFVPLLVPVLNTLASYPFMVIALRRGELRIAVARMLVWALTMGVCATAMSFWLPDTTDRLFIRGQAYRVEMHTWVMTGQGAESTPSAFIPQQAGHALVFSALALATGGALAMPMGAALMNYMGHYVGTLAAISPRPLVVMILGWHPWAVIRIISFVVIGVVLSGPLINRTWTFDWLERKLLVWAGAGLVADVVLKTLLAPTWQRWLYQWVFQPAR
jgi:hypothetical protein